MAETYLLATRCPVYRRHDSHLGSCMELENLRRCQGKRYKQRNCEAESTDATGRGGLLRNSEEADDAEERSARPYLAVDV